MNTQGQGNHRVATPSAHAEGRRARLVADCGSRQGEVSAGSWYRDRDARSLIAFGYLPWLGGLNLVWETAQLPLYTLWSEASAGTIAFSVAHCTAGDVAIGAAALFLALILGRERALAQWRWRRIAAGTALAGVMYTVFSEWNNTAILGSWAYSDLMPVLKLAGVDIGLSPLLQWLVLPPLALVLACKGRRRTI